ncbi:MAG: hypothetical protein FWD23_17900, partial [Oscillospiraceae bacterium]|nr:hypothetical protein [Oscillospiraceae bacterium]
MRGKAGQKGSALLMALIFITLVVALGVGLLLLAHGSVQQSLAVKDFDQGYYAAESAAQMAAQIFLENVFKDDTNPVLYWISDEYYDPEYDYENYLNDPYETLSQRKEDALIILEEQLINSFADALGVSGVRFHALINNLRWDDLEVDVTYIPFHEDDKDKEYPLTLKKQDDDYEGSNVWLDQDEEEVELEYIEFFEVFFLVDPEFYFEASSGGRTITVNIPTNASLEKGSMKKQEDAFQKYDGGVYVTSGGVVRTGGLYGNRE